MFSGIQNIQRFRLVFYCIYTTTDLIHGRKKAHLIHGNTISKCWNRLPHRIIICYEYSILFPFILPHFSPQHIFLQIIFLFDSEYANHGSHVKLTVLIEIPIWVLISWYVQTRAVSMAMANPKLCCRQIIRHIMPGIWIVVFPSVVGKLY